MIERYYYEDGFLFKKKSGKKISGCIMNHGYRSTTLSIKGKRYDFLLHRLIFFYHKGYFPEMIDHKNRIKTDNKIENLRPCTRSQNSANAKYPNPKKRKDGKYEAIIKVNKKVIWLGAHEDKHFAKELMKKEKIKHFGEFCPN